MKTTVLSLLILCYNILGATNNGQNSALRKYISQNVSYPTFLKAPNTHEKVTVKFQIDENGEIKPLFIYANSDKLKKHVEQELKSLKVKFNNSETDIVYSLELSFIMK